MQHEPLSSWGQAILAEYQKVVSQADDPDGIRRTQAIRLTVDSIQRRISNGEIDFDTDGILKSAIRAEVERADRSQGRSADAALARTIRGEITLDMEDDPFLNTVVTIGNSRRKSWRNVTADDLREMYELRAENTKRQVEALKQFEQDYHAFQPVLMEYGTVGKAIMAGAFQARQVA
jgi:hypothetical protein